MFTQGQIVRLKCENVLTYRKMEIFPCQRLNLIIGANGTGKSTMITAITLGLGGNAQQVSRGKDLKDIVKLGEKEAKIEVELYYSKKNIVIKRKFDINGNSRFSINGKPATHEKIMKLAEEVMNIQIGNLCQILPQEKLEQFAKMNDHDRLVGTLKTVGDPLLSKWLEELKSGKDIEAELRYRLTCHKNELIEKKNTREGMEGIYTAIMEKDFIIDGLKLLKRRRAWQFYFHLKQTLNIVNEKIKNKEPASQKMVNVLKSMMAEAQSSYSYQATVKEKSNAVNNKLLKLVQDVKKKQNEISITIDKINDVKTAFKQKENRYKTQEHDIRLLKETIEKTKLKISSAENVDEKIRLADSETMRLEPELRKIHISKEMANDELNAKRSEWNAINVKLTRLNDVKERKMRMLEGYHEDCFRGMKWLEKNRHMFKGEVFGPMFLYLNIADPKNAKYVEMSIANRDLLAFFCEFREDTSILVKELREKQKLKISVVSARTDVTEQDITPPYSIESLRHLGFRAYVKDFLSGPPRIVEYLIAQYQLHLVPVGNETTFKVTSQIPREFKVFYTDELRFQCSIVQLTGEKIESSRDIVDARYLAANVDESELYELQHLRDSVGNQVKELEEKYRILSEQVATGDKQMKQLRTDVAGFKAMKADESRLHDTLKRKMKECNMLKNSVINLDQEKNACNLEIKLTLAKVCNLYVELSDLSKSTCETFVEYQKETLGIEQAKKMHQKNLNTSTEFQKSLKQESSSLNTLGNKKKRLQKIFKAIYSWAMRATNGIDPRRPEFPHRKMFFKLTGNMITLNRVITRQQAKIDCLGEHNDGQKIINNYKHTVKAIEHLEKKIDKYETKLQSYYEDLDQKKEKWLTGVKSLIETIDNNFRKFFEMMDCSGAVCLYEGENNEEDFKTFGIQIKVKFRTGDELQILNSHVQSGGERAVSVAIYLLSLQQLTHVPFRCIDEINQGMDANNERRIFNLISKASEERGNTQIFLLTPKLLPNLHYPRHCKIFYPFNGVGSLPHDKFSQYKIQSGTQTENDGDDE